MADVAALGVRIGASIEGFEQTLGAAALSLEGFFKRVDVSLADVGRTGLILAGAGAAIVAFLGLAARAAGEAAAEQTKLAAAIERSGKAFDLGALQQQQKALAELSRFSIEAVTSVQRILIQFGATSTQVDRLTPLILDLSRALDRDLLSTAEAVGRGLTGAQSALQRFVGEMPGAANLSDDFGAAVGELEKRFGGFAAAAGRTLPDTLARLRNELQNLIQAIGAPLVGPLTSVVELLGRFVKNSTAAAEGAPALVRIFVDIAAAAGLVLLSGGSILGLLSQIGQASIGVTVLSKAFGSLDLIARGASIFRLFTFVAESGGIFTALGTVISAHPVAALILLGATALLALGNLNRLSASAQAVFAFIGRAAQELGAGFVQIGHGLATLDFREVIAGADRVSLAFHTAATGGISAYTEALKKAEEENARGIGTFDRLRAGALSFVTFLGTVIGEFGTGIVEIGAGLATLDFGRVAAGADRTALAFRKAREEGVQEYNRELQHTVEEHAKVTASGEETTKGLAALKVEFEEAAAAADIFAKRQAQVANQRAIVQLQVKGLTPEDLQAIEETRLRAVAAGEEQALQIRIAAREREVRELRAKSPTVDINKEIVDSERALEDDRQALSASRLQNIQRTAEAVVTAEKDSAELRIRVERDVRQGQADLAQVAIRAAATVAQARLQGERDAADRQIALIALVEQTRVGLLTRTIGIARSVASAIAAAQDVLSGSQAAREEAALHAAQLRRAEAVRQGLLTDSDARRLDAEEQFAFDVRNARREIALVQQQTEFRIQQSRLEAAAAVATAQTRLESLKAEENIRRIQIQTNQKIREADLTAEEASLRAEIEGKRAAAQAEADIEIQAARRRISSRQAQGLISPEEARLQQQQIDAIAANQRASDDRAVREFTLRQDGIRAKLVATREATTAQLEAIDQDEAARRIQIGQELQAALVELAAQDIGVRAAAVAKIQALQGRLTASIEVEQERLKGAGFTTAEIEARLAPAKAALNEIRAFGTETVGAVQAALTILQQVYDRFATSLRLARIQILEAIKLLQDPNVQRLLQGGTQPPALPAPPVGPSRLPAPAAPSSLGSGAQFSQTFTLPILLDGRQMAAVVIEIVDGELRRFEQATA